MAGLFSVLGVGVSGLTSQQTAINVTSHNIANANSPGYTRQMALLQATRPYNAESFNSLTGAGQLGTGSEVAIIKRVRDSFIDYQIRDATTTQGEYNASEKYISQIEGVFNEPSDTGISTLIGKFFSDWQKLSTNPASASTRNIVATDSSTLAGELNYTYNQLQSIKTNITSSIQSSVVDVNSTLNEIHELNKKIMIIKSGEDEPNDLMDKRDNLIDSLSAKLGVTIDRKSLYGVDITSVVQTDPLSTLGVNDPFSKLPTDSGVNSVLISSNLSINENRFSFIKSISNIKDGSGNPTTQYAITYYKNGDTTSSANAVNITVDLSTSLPATTNTLGYPTTAEVVAERLQQISENRVLWADSTGTARNGDGTVSLTDGGSYKYEDLKMLSPVSGEFKGYSEAQQNTDNYINKLNNLAKGLAFAVNAIHSGYTDPTNANGTAPTMLSTDATGVALAKKDYLPFFVNSAVANSLYDSSKNLTGANLDSVLNAEQDITAGNISVNKSIINDVMKMKTRTHDDQFASEADNNIDASGNGSRALLIANLQNNFINFQSIGSSTNLINNRADLFDATKGGNTLTESAFGNNTQGMTIDTYFKGIVSAVASQEQTIKRTIANQQGLLDVFVQNKESVSGVSMDEEMANLVQFQHAYQANAKIIATVDSLLDVVINGLKR